MMRLEAGDPRVFPPIVATHLVKLACELPEDEAGSLSTWTCGEPARTLIRDHIVDTISASSVQRIPCVGEAQAVANTSLAELAGPSRRPVPRARQQHLRLVHAQARPT